MSHGPAKTACKNNTILKEFPKDIEDFANLFHELQEKRHEADYDPFAQFQKSSVEADLDAAGLAIKKFTSVPIKDKRAFTALVLFPTRKT